MEKSFLDNVSTKPKLLHGVSPFVNINILHQSHTLRKLKHLREGDELKSD